MSKTPQFDKAIEAILNGFKPHKRTCPECGSVFDIYAEDIEFYKKLKVPAPTLCPKCRLQRRLGWRINFLPIFYKKTCSAPGHKEKVIAFYSEQNPVKVYDDDYYLSDKWDGLEFDRDYDFSKPFFEQFHQLALTAPHQTLQKDPKSVGCDYVVSGVSSKSCYYVGTPYHSENIYYGRVPFHSKDCMEVLWAEFSEQCYEGINITRCYNCHFCYESSNCLDSWFLYDCRNCSNCFGCTNLRNKKYYFFNKPLSRQEYQKKIKSISLGQRTVLREYRKKFEQLLKGSIRKNLTNVKTQNSLGNDLKNCKDCFQSFAIVNSENIRYSASMDDCHDVMDLFGASNDSFCYDTTGATGLNQAKFSAMNRVGLEIEYCSECNNCQYCFGCFGLKNKKFCIFNKQYSESDYWQLVDKIKTQMLKSGEYGEFFPLKLSHFPYQDSNAQVEFPLSRAEILKNGWHWEEPTESDIDLTKFEVLKPEQVPDDIADVGDDILDKVILCEKTNKPFRITKFELEFYRKHNLPLPTVHPLERIKNYYEYCSFWHHFRFWKSNCSKCNEKMYSGYDPAKKLKVYCEKCYLAEVV